MNVPISMPSTFPVTCHTDFVGKDSIFVAIEGYADNGVNYIKKAIEKGARTIVVHHNTFLDDELRIFMCAHDVVVERVDNTRKALAQLSAQAANFPAQKLKIVGITGTKGKTTTSFLLAHMLHSAGYKTALISSAQNRINGNTFLAPLTTPQPDYLQQFLKLCVDNAVDYVVMEVAAQALTLHRVEGITFCGIIFTNFSHEHLEFYRDLEEYFRAKCLIFDMAAEHAPLLINRDNKQCAQLLMHNSSVASFGFGDDCSGYRGELIADTISTIALRVHYQGCGNDFICSSLFGTYNAYNVLAATSMAIAMQIQPQEISGALHTFSGVPGRLQEHILTNGARCFIDYAHNPESFQAVLSTLRALTSQLIVVFGAGGGRDKSKRPMMGVIATNIADILVITSDNPRLEDAAVIAGDIVRDIPTAMKHKIVQELDRKKAIECAYFLSNQGSIIALLGKGPDEYQIIGTTKHYFSEQSIVEQL
ncbi:MAG TPA: UDP-N-acetylmuramoyl-L-alanyl-D-glutamate--2,6-diaminopimelate ligase [Candidatus Babeliales bacterium]|nr:UDP-N-acetylmuramoyl-L-alanyl-D-glutamate--2,6-diaminopimelate ligase [Candidatus Babeliales bacterium]